MEDDKKYNARCDYYTSLTDTSQPVVYLVYRDYFIFYTHSKEQALVHINEVIDVYHKATYTMVEKDPENTNDVILFEAILNRGGPQRGHTIHIKVVEVPALKDMGYRNHYPPTEGTMYFCTLQLSKETVYRGYTSFFGDMVHTSVEVVDNFVEAPDKKYFWSAGMPRQDKQCVLKVIDRLHKHTQTSYAHIKVKNRFRRNTQTLLDAHTKGECTKETPVFDFYKVYDLKDFEN